MEKSFRGSVWSAGGFFVDDLLERRPGRGPLYVDTHLVVTQTDKPSGLRFAGEIDVSNSAAVGESVRVAFGESGNQHLDLTNLSFCDISGVRALVEAALELGEHRRLLLHGLPQQLQTVMRVMGWTELPSLVLCGCGDAA